MTALTARQQGILCCGLSGLCYGLIGYFGEQITSLNVSVFTMLFWRFGLAALFCMPTLFDRQYTRLSPWSLLGSLLCGFLFYGSASVLYFYASQFIGTGVAMVIAFIYPSIIVLLNFVFLKKPISPLYYLVFGMIFSGMFFLVDVTSFAFDLMGIGLALLSAITYANYIIFNKRIELPPNVSTFTICLGSSLICLLCAYIDGSFTYLNSDSLFNILALSTISTVVPVFLMSYGVSKISAEEAGLVSVLEPIAVVVIGIILLEEEMQLRHAFGILAILSGATIGILGSKDKH